jgi:hypothetical protein
LSSEIAEQLSLQTRDLISRFEIRAGSFAGRKDLTKLTIPVDKASAEEFARKFLGEGEHVATGIDGSMDFDERLQMMLFYSNATAYSCPVHVGNTLEFVLDSAKRDLRLNASAAIPLWAEDLGSVFSNYPEIDLELEHSMERIPNAFMTLGELYLAALACAKSRIIFLDRPMSGTYSTLSRDVRNLLKRGESKLTKWSRGKVSLLDVYLGLHLGSPSMTIPVRGRFLVDSIIGVLMTDTRGVAEMASTLHVGESDVRRARKQILTLDERFGNSLLADRDEDSMSLTDEARGYWGRISTLSLEYAKATFESRIHPLALSDDEYLTVLDVNAVSLFLLELLCEKARERDILLIGVAKDTTTTDIARAILPFAEKEGYVNLASPPPRLKNDRVFLAILSSENPSMSTPWRTFSYDSAYSTIINIGGTFMSARKVVSRERLFSRSFFQLRTLKSDKAVRSQVFLFDRIYDERFDSKSVRRFAVEERSGTSQVEAYFEGNDGSEVSNAILHVLSLTDNPEVFEAFGHNQLLYLADKAVKVEVRMLRSSLRGVADLRVGGVSSRKKIFGLVTSYREQREEAEQARMRSAVK